MSAEIDLYLKDLGRLFDKLYSSLDGLSEAELNCKPPAPESNSIFVIATHMMGNARAWILGICCGAPIERDRPAEFRASGSDAKPLINDARNLFGEIDASLRALDAASLDELREARQHLWGAGTAEPVTGREAITHVLTHWAEHMGQIVLTKDLSRARAGS
jgi:uncharacterized damage-inducible protein DinB